MTLPNGVYDFLKWLALVVIPALSMAYAAIGKIFGWPNVDSVVGVLAAVCTFLGAILGLSSKNYKGDGTLNVTTKGDANDAYSFDFTTPLIDLPTKSTVVFKVNAVKEEPPSQD